MGTSPLPAFPSLGGDHFAKYPGTHMGQLQTRHGGTMGLGRENSEIELQEVKAASKIARELPAGDVEGAESGSGVHCRSPGQGGENP